MLSHGQHVAAMSKAAVRRENLARIVELRFGNVIAECARAIGRDDAQLWALLNGVRNIGERLARDIEDKLKLEENELDRPNATGAPRAGEQQAPEYLLAKIPVVGNAQLGEDGFYDELAYPVGHGDGFVHYPTRDANAYALRVKGDSMRPRIKHGEFVVIEPHHPPEPGDEVLVRTKDGKTMVKVLDFRRGGVVQLSSVNEEHKPLTVDDEQIDRLHYVAAIVKSSRYYRTLS